VTPALVPWRPGDPHRERSWALTRRSWERHGFRIVTGDTPGPFSRAGARNAAAEAAGPWAVAVFVDADTIVRDAGPVREAVALATETGGVVVPHDQYVGLSAGGTRLVLAGREEGWSMVARRKENSPLGVLVIARPAWETLGGFDERFTGWGGEDGAFLRAARTLVDVQRLPGEIVHLWHPIAGDKLAKVKRPPELAFRYGAAEGDPVAMLAILAERRGEEAA
jgi:hypothetical protein